MFSILASLRYFLLLFIGFGLLLTGAAHGQTLTGTVTAASAAEPIPYANLGIPGKSVGTVADEHGAYQLAYTAANLTDTVRISSVGYEPQNVLLRELVARPVVRLTQAAVGADCRAGAGSRAIQAQPYFGLHQQLRSGDIQAQSRSFGSRNGHGSHFKAQAHEDSDG